MRPSGVYQHSGIEEEVQVDPQTYDSADANAIDEVNVAYDNVKEIDCLDLSKEGTELWEAGLKRYVFFLTCKNYAYIWERFGSYLSWFGSHNGG